MPDKVARLSEAQAARLTRFYEQAEREILDRLNRALLRANKTEYLAAMKKNINQILEQLRAGSRTWCTEAIPRVYVQGATMADRMITEAGFEVTSGAGFGAIHQQAAQVLAENAFESLDNVAQAIGRQTEDIYRELALENIRGTVVGYDTWKQSARNFREQLAERGVTGFKDKTGREWNMRSYAEMVARTTTMEAHNQGTVNRLAENDFDLVIVSQHTGACPLCVPWEGKVLSISGKTPGYPTLAEAEAAGLFHPNCAHAMGLYVDLDAEIKRLEGEVGTAGAPPKHASTLQNEHKPLYNKTADAFKSTSYRNIDKTFAEQIDKRFLDLANHYPINTQRIAVKALKKTNELGHFQGQLINVKGRTLGFKNEIVISNVHMADFNTAQSAHNHEASRRGGLMRNKSALATVDHEYAHAIDTAFALKQNPGLEKRMMGWVGKEISSSNIAQQVNNLNRELIYSTDRLSVKIGDQLMKDYGIDNVPAFMSKVKQELGVYAASSMKEFLAEGFSAYQHIPTAEHSEFLRKFGEYFDRYFEEVFQ